MVPGSSLLKVKSCPCGHPKSLLIEGEVSGYGWTTPVAIVSSKFLKQRWGNRGAPQELRCSSGTNSSDGITCEVVLKVFSRLKTPSHCTFFQLNSNTLEVLGFLTSLLCFLWMSSFLTQQCWSFSAGGMDLIQTEFQTGIFSHGGKLDTTTMPLLWRISSLTKQPDLGCTAVISWKLFGFCFPSVYTPGQNIP